MRNSLHAEIGGRKIKISEMTAVEAAMFIPVGVKLAEAADKEAAELAAVLTENGEVIIEILARCVDAGDEIKDWGAGAVIALLPKFFEVNGGFFSFLRGLVTPKQTP